MQKEGKKKGVLSRPRKDESQDALITKLSSFVFHSPQGQQVGSDTKSPEKRIGDGGRFRQMKVIEKKMYAIQAEQVEGLVEFGKKEILLGLKLSDRRKQSIPALFLLEV